MNIKIQIRESNLTKSIVRQMDTTYPEALTWDLKPVPVCRIVWGGEEWMVLQLDEGRVVRMRLETYINCGLEKPLGIYGRYPKVMILK